MITRSATLGGLWCASAMCGRLSHEAAAAAASGGMCAQNLVLKGWKEKQSPGRVRVDEHSDGKGVILIWAASEDGLAGQECREG